MKIKINKQTIYNFIISIITILLTGCSEKIALMHPQGTIGKEEKSLILIAITIMLIIIIPVIIMELIFCIKYRNSINKKYYKPNWHHSNIIEFTIWTIPILIIIFLATLTWISTKKLDPNNPIQSDKHPILIQVISLDWKWLFIYPKYNIATINEISFPINTPVQFQITSSSVMNSFFIPQLGSQIYAMNGMKSTLHLIANQTGTYQGISSNFSGSGFSKMKFTVLAKDTKNDFKTWIQNIKNSTNILDDINYQKIQQPSTHNTPIYFSYVKKNLFNNIINNFKNTF
ncbi:MAG: cytochrome bo3 ubiquinol oxidase subunit 2 [Candidatus Westeberhardia cardiocondylae]|nr:cytochrome bo3 ubiquinol oxidase subunit 2 [Candidatus Westeberhardia cardiocondylae]